MWPKEYYCNACESIINAGELFDHIRGHKVKAREQQARVEQVDATYYGYPKNLSGWDSEQEPQMLDRKAWPSDELTAEQKEALSIYAKTSPEFNDIERRA